MPKGRWPDVEGKVVVDNPRKYGDLAKQRPKIEGVVNPVDRPLRETHPKRDRTDDHHHDIGRIKAERSIGVETQGTGQTIGAIPIQRHRDVEARNNIEAIYRSETVDNVAVLDVPVMPKKDAGCEIEAQ
jgi:hypothetical protein